LIVAFLIPIAFIIILGVMSYKNASKALVTSYEESTYSSVVTARNYFDLATSAIELRLTQLKGYDSLKDYYSGTYKDDPVTETLTFKEMETYLSTTAFADNLISNIAMFCKRGQAICTTGSFDKTGAELVEAYELTDEGIRDNEAKGGFFWSGRHTFLDDNLAVDSSKPKVPYGFSVSSAFYANGLKQLGYMVGDISYELVMEQLKALEVGDESLFLAISADGYEVTSHPIEGEAVASQTFYQDVANGKEVEGSTYVDYKGEKYLFSYAKVGETGIVVIGMVPYSYLTSQATSILVSTVILVLIAVAVAILVATFIATGMGRTIHRMIKVMRQAAEGDLTVSVRSHRNDEFRVLSDTSNHMISNMKSLIEKANRVKDTMAESTKEVAVATDSLSVATKNISNSIEEIRLGIVQQAEDSEKCLVQSEELGNRVQSMSESIEAIEQLTIGSKEVVNEGVVSITVLKDKANETAQITKTIITDMGSLENESKSIGKIINVINDIAEQTNLLSLNASIEAARAGEAGRGFAVVADEIRKLAEQSMRASNEIGNIIRSIQSKTKHTVETVRVSDDIVKSQSIALDTTVSIFEKINSSVEGIAVKLKDITAGIDNIKEAENTTIVAIESISAVSEETAAASEEVDNAANRQVSTVENLKEATINLTKEAEELNKALNIFKI
jgi:methyl-accepting chemotaxis protein